MPTTTYLGLRYPSLSDSPNIPQDMGNLASDTDTKLGGVILCTSSTRPTAREGAVIYETDTAYLRVYSGGAWKTVSIPGVTGFKPLVRLVAQTTQSIADNTDTLLTYGTSSEEVDTHGFHSTSTNTGRITPLYPGYYRLTGRFVIQGRTDFVTIGCGILKNGAASGDWDRRGPNAQTAVRVVSTTCIQQANGSTDYFEHWCHQNNAADVAVSSSVSPTGYASTFECEYLGPLTA